MVVKISFSISDMGSHAWRRRRCAVKREGLRVQFFFIYTTSPHLGCQIKTISPTFVGGKRPQHIQRVKLI